MRKEDLKIEDLDFRVVEIKPGKPKHTGLVPLDIWNWAARQHSWAKNFTVPGVPKNCQYTGIACPECGTELYESREEYREIKTIGPSGKVFVGCLKCPFKGLRWLSFE